MPTLEINGRDVEVDDSFLQMSPEQQNAVVDEIAASLTTQPKADVPEEIANLEYGQAPDGMVLNPKTGQMEDLRSAANPNIPTGRANAAALGVGQGAGFGLLDEAAAGLSSLTGGDYGYDVARMREAERRASAEHPGAYYGGMVGGGVTTAVAAGGAGLSPMASLPARSGLGARMAAGAKEGAAYGGLYGFGSGEGATDRLTDAAGGAAMGGAIGGAVPVVAQGIKAAAKPVVDAVKARVNPGAYANQKISERLADSNMTASQAAARMDDGLSLADVGGKSARSLLRTTTNIPGKAQDAVASKLTLRQMGQGDRLKSVVSQTLADADGYLAAKDDIAQTARRLAKPLYDKAYSTPVHFSETLEGVLNTPAGKEALRRAEVLAANEQIPFQQLFINVADDGASATVRRVPDARGWDYIKRAMDDMIEGGKDSITKKLSNEARIVNNLKDKMLSEIDRVNPAYAAARKAWSGQMSLDNALEFGRDAMRQSPEAVRRQMAKLGPAEKEAARAGAAEWIRNAIDQRNFTQNAILKFFSNRQQVKNLRALFDNDEQFGTFRKAIFAEAKKRATYEAVKGNSTTARQLADMAETGGLRDGVDFARNMATQGPVSATLQWVGSRLRMLGGLTPEVAENIAQKLTATQPGAVRQIASELARIERKQLTSAQRANEVQALISRALSASTVPAILGN